METKIYLYKENELLEFVERAQPVAVDSKRNSTPGVKMSEIHNKNIPTRSASFNENGKYTPIENDYSTPILPTAEVKLVQRPAETDVRLSQTFKHLLNLISD